MIDDALIESLKEQYGDIFSFEHPKYGVFIFRRAKLGEFSAIQKMSLSSAEVEEKFIDVCLLYKEENVDIDRLPAGIVSNLAQEILGVSGFTDPKYAKQFITDTRSTLSSNVFVLMKAMIITAMPSYKTEDLDGCTFSELVEKLIISEKIFETQQSIMTGNMVTLDLIDPEEEAAKAVKQHKKSVLQGDGQAPPDDPIARRLQAALGSI